MPSMPRPGGLPQSAITSEVPAASRWKPLASAIAGAASPEPERALEVRALAGERQDEASGEARIAGGRQPFIVADPGNDALAEHVAPPGDGRPAPFALDPVVDQAVGECRCAGIAAIAQVAQ